MKRLRRFTFRRKNAPGNPDAYLTGDVITYEDERRMVHQWVDRLAPDAVDVATGGVLDGYINERKRWRTACIRSHCEGRMADFDKAEAKTARELEWHRTRSAPDRQRLERTEQALTAAKQRFEGKDTKTDGWQRDPKPGPGFEGFENPTLGRQGGSLVYVLLLVLAAAADLVAFYQVMGLTLRSQTTWALWAATIGFTAVALGLAHLGGRFARGLRAGEKGVRRWMVWTVGLAWAVLGLGAFLLRLLIPEAQDESSISLEGDLLNTGSDVASEELWGRAVVLLILYVATGAVACLGAYLLHNPLRSDYHKADGEHRRANRKAARSSARLVDAETRHRHSLEARERERRRWELAIEQDDAFLEDLKNQARLSIASRLQSPSATTGLVPFDGQSSRRVGQQTNSGNLSTFEGEQ